MGTTGQAIGHRGAIIVGASSGMGAALAHELASRGYWLALAARQVEQLERLADELTASSTGGTSGSSGAPVRVYRHDVRDYDAVPALLKHIARDLADAGATPRLLVYAAGTMPRGENGTWSFEDVRAMMETNAIGAMAWMEAAAALFRGTGGGTLVGISSVAGDRGRKGNSAYMASKAALSTYLESLRYRLHGTGVRVVTVKPGYVATQMTAGAKLPGPLVISAEKAARRIAKLSEGGRDVAYVPGYWGLIMRVIRWMPATLMPRLPI